VATSIVIINQKGGVGKTTTTVNLAYGLSLIGKKVLVLDLDAQGNLSSWLGAIEKSGLSAYDFLMGGGGRPLSVREGLDVIAGGQELIGLDQELAARPAKELVLKNKLVTFRADYDFILMDTPPSLGILSLNALVASDYYIIPVQAEYLALEGLAHLVNNLRLITETVNKNLACLGVLITMVDNRLLHSKQVIIEIEQVFTNQVFKTKIPRSIKVSEAASYSKSLLEYDPTSPVSQAYFSFISEVLERVRLQSLKAVNT
jgi:chromosome partitioning protein